MEETYINQSAMAASNRSATAEHQEFDLQSVKEFMIANGGRVKNHQLVNYFRRFLNDPRFKGRLNYYPNHVCGNGYV